MLSGEDLGGQLVQEREEGKSAGEETLIMETPVRFPIFEEDVSSLIYKRETPTPKASPAISTSLPEFGIPRFSQSPESTTVNCSQSLNSAVVENLTAILSPWPDTHNMFPLQTPRSPSPIPEILNPLDRPSTPDSDFHNAFADPRRDPESLPAEGDQQADDDDVQSITLSRTAGREDDDSNMSDWTEAFDNATDSDVGTEDFDDAESDESDVVTDAESEASWARVRNNPSSSSSGRYGFN